MHVTPLQRASESDGYVSTASSRPACHQGSGACGGGVRSASIAAATASGWSGLSSRSTAGMSERDVPVLARRVAFTFRDRGPQRVDQDGPGTPRLDHVVHVAALCRGIGVRKSLAVVGDQLGTARLGVV